MHIIFICDVCLYIIYIKEEKIDHDWKDLHTINWDIVCAGHIAVTIYVGSLMVVELCWCKTSDPVNDQVPSSDTHKD